MNFSPLYADFLRNWAKHSSILIKIIINIASISMWQTSRCHKNKKNVWRKKNQFSLLFLAVSLFLAWKVVIIFNKFPFLKNNTIHKKIWIHDESSCKKKEKKCFLIKVVAWTKNFFSRESYFMVLFPFPRPKLKWKKQSGLLFGCLDGSDKF